MLLVGGIGSGVIAVGIGAVAIVVASDGPGGIDAGVGGENNALTRVDSAGNDIEERAILKSAGGLKPLGVGLIEARQARARISGISDSRDREGSAGDVIRAGGVPGAGCIGGIRLGIESCRRFIGNCSGLKLLTSARLAERRQQCA